MSSRRTEGRDGRSAFGQMLFLLVLLPALIVGPALGGMAAWIHSHGPSGGHVHLLAKQLDHGDLGTLHDWHDAQHRHDHEDGTHEEDEPAPTGLLIELPQILAALSSGPTLASAGSIHLPALLPSARWHSALVESTHRPDLCRSGWPPQRVKRSGVAALLCVSHAILI